MFLSELRIENFRLFGEGDDGLTLTLRPGLNALVGQNDTGKTAVIDALRHALGTRDQEFFPVEESDFHQPYGATTHRNKIEIRCKFEDLTLSDKAAFSEYVTYEGTADETVPVIYLNWTATAPKQEANRRNFTHTETRSGKEADGPFFETEAKSLLCAAYLRPLRDAQRAMSAGRSSRLSQILQHTEEIKSSGQEFDPNQTPPADPKTLSVRGIGDLADALLKEHQGVQSARDNLNTKYLSPLSFAGDAMEGRISVGGPRSDSNLRLRLLLEKLDLELLDSNSDGPPNRGLGSNNLLFMACELLLLGSEIDGFPLLLIEEPEAHLHPQRQLLLIQFLQKTMALREDGQRIQIVLTTHSPSLASSLDLNSLVLFQRRKAFPLAVGFTELNESDYGFLERFLDATKANLFFARGLLIVEGDAENLLIPTLARLIGRDLTANGVSVVNVGGIGLGRFARIYLRKNPSEGVITVRVACITDLDVMPDCAPEIIGLTDTNSPWPEANKRQWHAKKDYTEDELDERRQELRARASGQQVETFVSDEWTLEYDLAYAGLAAELWLAARLAQADDRIKSGKVSRESVVNEATSAYGKLAAQALSNEELASHVYALIKRSRISKAITAQYLACLLELLGTHGYITQDSLRTKLPKYLVDAIDYVTIDATVSHPEELLGE